MLLLLPAAIACYGCQQATPTPPPAPVPVKPPAARAPAPTRAPAPKPVAPTPVAGRVTEISLEQAFTLQQQGRALIFDARPAFVYAFGHLPGAINWPRHSFDAEKARHEPEILAAKQAKRPVFIYCTDATCPDARAVAERIAALGYDLSVMAGGYASWKEAGLPVE